MTDRESIVADLRRMADDSQENRETFSPRALRELAERFERGEDKSKASMTDRVSSIIVYLKREADLIKEEDGPPGCNDMKAAMRTAYRFIAHQIERGDDLKPAKPKATIADLLALHDLDLGALAHVTGVIGDDIDDGDAMALCDKYQSVSDWHELVADVLPSIAAAFDARQFAALGAKVRAALSAPTIKAATPRVLQSADEAPCGALMQDGHGVCSVRRPDGSGWNLYHPARACILPHEAYPYNPAKEAWHGGPWKWDETLRGVRGPVTVIAEGLTEAECRHLSGLSAADALAWCKARDKACATHDAAVIDRLQRDGDSLRSLLAVIRHALGAGDHDDIVKHARAIKARADRA